MASLLWLIAVTGITSATYIWLRADSESVVSTFKRSGEYSWMPSQNLLWGTRLRLVATRSLSEPWNDELATAFENARDIFFHRITLIVDSAELTNEFATAPSYALFSASMLHARDELDRISVDGSTGLKPEDARKVVAILEALDPVMTQFTADLRDFDLQKRSAIYDTLMSRRDVFVWTLGLAWLLLSFGGVFVLWRRACANEDLSARREALERKTAAMQTAEELIETRNSILNMVAHDLRSPLQVLMSTAETLQMKLPKEQTELRDLVQQIDGTTEQIATHLRDLNTFAKALDGNISTETQNLDLDQITQQAFAPHMRDLADQKGVNVQLAVDGLKRGLQGDRTRLTQILSNLIDNAVKYTDRGSINVMVETRPLNEHAVMLTFSVTDTGVGMSPPDVKRAFDPFVRLPMPAAPPKPGFGIGLSLVKHLVELLNGTMEVRSTPGIGTAFVVRLPTPIAHHAQGVNAPGYLEIRSGAITVMVVDDVPEVLHALLDTVKRQGAVALGAHNAAEAIALANVHRIDLALIDYQMPVRNGLSLASELSRRHPHMHLVLTSAFPEPDLFSTETLAGVGARGFAEKPLKGTTIRRLIDDAQAHAAQREDPASPSPSP